MKYIYLTAALIFGFNYTPAYSINCQMTCSKHHCKGGKNNWDECFKGCWRNSESHIKNCKAGAAESGNIDGTQQMIMGYFNK